MARPLRLEFPGAVYHVTARGDRREPIFEHDADRLAFLDLLAKEAEQQGWLMYAFCLMSNHYHLLLETPEPTLVRGMRRLNGVYTQAFNRRHGRVGHVLQGRYKAILVDKDSYLLELCRYVVLNPVRARMVSHPVDWPWSSYLATAGKLPCPGWLSADKVLALLSERPRRARQAYQRFVAEGIGRTSPWDDLKGQIFLGSDAFCARMGKLLGGKQLRGVPRGQLAPQRPEARAVLAAVASVHRIPVEAMLEHTRGEPFKHAVYLLRRRANLPLAEVASIAGVSTGRISQIQTSIETGQPDAMLARLLRKL